MAWSTCSRLAIKASGGTVTLTGSAGEKLALTANLAGIETRMPIEGGEAHIALDTGTASINGDMQSAVLDVAANVAEIALPQGRFEAIKLTAHSDAFNLTTRSGAVAATIDTGATQLTNTDLDRLVKGPLKVATTLDVTPEVIGFSPITIGSANLDGALAGTFSLASNRLNTTFKLSGPTRRSASLCRGEIRCAGRRRRHACDRPGRRRRCHEPQRDLRHDPGRRFCRAQVADPDSGADRHRA